MPTQQERYDQAILVLKKVRELFSDKSRWAAGALAYSRYSETVHADSPRAVRWCASGAIQKVTRESFRGYANSGVREQVEYTASTLLVRALRTRPYDHTDIPHVNDGHNGYERIMEGLAKAVGVSPKRREAALKGWATRRHNQWLREVEAESVDPRPEVMSFGGTIVASPVAERKEVAV
jgi:hypothetical protein